MFGIIFFSMGVLMPIYGYVYLGWVSGRLKIGATSNPDRRRRQIELAAGIRFEFFQSFHMYAPFAAEKWLHNRYAPMRIQTEWYAADLEFSKGLAAYLAPRVAVL